MSSHQLIMCQEYQKVLGNFLIVNGSVVSKGFLENMLGNKQRRLKIYKSFYSVLVEFV